MGLNMSLNLTKILVFNRREVVRLENACDPYDPHSASRQTVPVQSTGTVFVCRPSPDLPIGVRVSKRSDLP
jgi:hypothetical protein